MKLHPPKAGRATSMVQGLSLGIAVSITITLISAFILAKMVDKEILPWENIGYGIIISLIVAAFSGAWFSYRNIKHQRLLVCGLSGILYWTSLVVITILCYGSQFEGIGVTTGVILAGCMAAFLITTPKTKRISEKKFRSAHR